MAAEIRDLSMHPSWQVIERADPKIFSTAYDANAQDNASTTVSDTPSRHEVDAKVSASAAEARAEFHELRADVAAMKSEMKIDLSSVRVEMAGIRSEMAEFRADVANGNANLVKWFVGTSVSMAGVVIAVMSFMLNANKAAPALQPATQPIVITLPSAATLPAPTPATGK